MAHMNMICPWCIHQKKPRFGPRHEYSSDSGLVPQFLVFGSPMSSSNSFQFAVNGFGVWASGELLQGVCGAGLCWAWFWAWPPEPIKDVFNEVPAPEKLSHPPLGPPLPKSLSSWILIRWINGKTKHILWVNLGMVPFLNWPAKPWIHIK